MKKLFGYYRWTAIDIDAMASALWNTYSESVGGKAFNGDPLPPWDEFSRDPAKRVQSDGYRAMARTALGEPMSVQEGAARLAVEVLNRAFAADPNAVHALICNRVPCNDDLAEDPTIVVDCPGPINGEDSPHYQIGALGLINGVLGELTGGLTVAVRFSEADPETGGRKIEGFQLYTPSAVQNHETESV